MRGFESIGHPLIPESHYSDICEHSSVCISLQSDDDLVQFMRIS